MMCGGSCDLPFDHGGPCLDGCGTPPWEAACEKAWRKERWRPEDFREYLSDEEVVQLDTKWTRLEEDEIRDHTTTTDSQIPEEDEIRDGFPVIQGREIVIQGLRLSVPAWVRDRDAARYASDIIGTALERQRQLLNDKDASTAKTSDDKATTKDASTAKTSDTKAKTSDDKATTTPTNTIIEEEEETQVW